MSFSIYGMRLGWFVTMAWIACAASLSNILYTCSLIHKYAKVIILLLLFFMCFCLIFRFSAYRWSVSNTFFFLPMMLPTHAYPSTAIRLFRRILLLLIDLKNSARTHQNTHVLRIIIGIYENLIDRLRDFHYGHNDWIDMPYLLSFNGLSWHFVVGVNWRTCRFCNYINNKWSLKSPHYMILKRLILYKKKK